VFFVFSFFGIFFSKLIFVDFIFLSHDCFYDFFQNYLCRFFLILSWLRIIITIKLNHMGKALLVYSQNTVNCYNISLNGFFMIFSKIVFVDFFEESIVVFITKHYQLLQRFFSWVFFPSKIIFVDLFLILSW